MPDPDNFNNTSSEKKRDFPQHITVDMGDRDIRSVGGSINTRLMMSVRNESGRVIKGFFTKNVYNSKKEIFDSLFSPGKRTDTEKHREYAEYLNKIFDEKVLYGTAPRGNTSQSYSSAVNASEFIDNYLRSHYPNDPLTHDRSVRKRVEFFKKNFAGNVVEFSPQQTNLIGWLQNKNVIGVDGFDSDKYGKDKEFWDYLGEILGAAAIAEDTVETSKQLVHQSENSNINKRNNAMYDYAALLGEPDLLARSSAMTVKWKGNTLHGTFMQKAKGIERKEVFKNAKKKAAEKAKNEVNAAPAPQENVRQKKGPDAPKKAAPKDDGFERGESRNVNDEGRLSYMEDRLNAFRKQLSQADLQELEPVRVQFK